ncbi:MAG: hypothetical protein WDW38_010623 [Sanguina aurantia]
MVTAEEPEFKAAPTLYHLVEEPVWRAAQKAGTLYKPPTYEQDGFVHLTADPELLIGVGNHFYKGVKCVFLLLCLDTAKLTAEVRYEVPAAVGDTDAATLTDKCPHLYGCIDFAAVLQELPVERAEDGTFLGIPGLV